MDGAERLKTEDMGFDGLAGLADAIDCGDERSSSPLELFAIDDPDIGFMAELNSPKPLDALLILRSEFGAFGFGGGCGLGPVSKKPPPLSGWDVI